ncbi:MAG: hypothetical protein AAFU57_08775 [Bacteroidota bacterium]
MEKKKDYLKLLKEYLPLIYIFLVCFGYANQTYFYYDRFDIDILSYLSIQELVLMFVPAGSFVIFLCLLLFLVIGPLTVFINDEEKKKDIEARKPKKHRQPKNKVLRFIDRVLDYVIKLISFLSLMYLIGVFPGIYIAYTYTSYKGIDLDMNPVFGLAIAWGIIFGLKLSLMSDEKKEQFYMNRVRVLGWSVFVLILYSYGNFRKAENILKGKPTHYVNFIVENKQVETNADTLYFGETIKYIFLRNIKTNENQIYNKNEIGQITMKKIKSSP